jgi:hypothetical protein
MAGLYQNAPEIDLLNRVKKPAVATAAFWEPFPTVTPALAAAPHGVVGLVATATGCASGVTGVRGAAIDDDTPVDAPGSFSGSNGASATEYGSDQTPAGRSPSRRRDGLGRAERAA